MIELLKALAPLIVELVLAIMGSRKTKAEERKQLREEIVASVRSGDASAVNRMAVRLRLARNVRRLEADRRRRHQADGGGAEPYS